MSKDDIVTAANYDELISMIEAARTRAWQAVNSELVALYWNVGKWLSARLEVADWGSKVVENVAIYLAEKRPDIGNFTKRTLYRMVEFYKTYKDDEIVTPLVTQITWTNHLVILLRAKSPDERRFYIEKCAAELEALDRDVRKPDENPSVGVILCTDKDDSVVEYALSRSMSPTMVASYQLALPNKEILQNRLRQITELVMEENQVTELPCSEEDEEKEESSK